MHHDLYQRFRLVMWWCGDAFLASLGSWTAHHLVATAYSSTAADHPFMTTVSPYPDACFKEDNMSYNKAQIISKWFPKHDNEITVHKWAPQSPNLNLREHGLSLGYGSMEDLHPGHAAYIYAATFTFLLLILNWCDGHWLLQAWKGI